MRWDWGLKTMDRIGEEQDNKEDLLLDLRICFNKLLHSSMGEDDTCQTEKTLLPELPIDPGFPVA